MRLLAAAVLFAICFTPAVASAQNAGPPPPAAAQPFTFTVPQSRVVVRVPDTSLRPSAATGNGPNYFKLERCDPQLIVSGWFEPAANYKGLDAFWQSESRSAAFAAPLNPTQIEMLHDGAWEIVAYDLPLPGGGIQSNLRAERVAAGTWIDLHLSTASTRDSARLRADLLAALRGVEVWEKIVQRLPLRFTRP